MIFTNQCTENQGARFGDPFLLPLESASIGQKNIFSLKKWDKIRIPFNEAFTFVGIVFCG